MIICLKKNRPFKLAKMTLENIRRYGSCVDRKQLAATMDEDIIRQAKNDRADEKNDFRCAFDTSDRPAHLKYNTESYVALLEISPARPRFKEHS